MPGFQEFGFVLFDDFLDRKKFVRPEPTASIKHDRIDPEFGRVLVSLNVAVPDDHLRRRKTGRVRFSRELARQDPTWKQAEGNSTFVMCPRKNSATDDRRHSKKRGGTLRARLLV
jgi:hypothetical protein